MKLDFNNTAQAFSHKSNSNLRQSFVLFQSLKYDWIIRWSLPLMRIALHLPFLRKLLKHFLFKQFIGGESIEESVALAKQIFTNHSIGSILDYSVEGQINETGFDEATKEIIKTINEGARNEAIPFSVFKMTAIASKRLLRQIQNKNINDKKAHHALLLRLDTIGEAVVKCNQPLFVDGEETWIQGGIFELSKTLSIKTSNNKTLLFHTIQCYRKDALTLLKQLKKHAEENNIKLGVKLVRGAYLEKEREQAKKRAYPSPICESKSATDQLFNEAITFCLNNHHLISTVVASHNEESYHHLAKTMNQLGIATNDDKVFCAQLYGMSDHISYNLIDAQYNVAKYVPYGPLKEVLPYLSRRAEENKSVGGQSSRELKLIKQELKRRRLFS